MTTDDELLTAITRIEVTKVVRAPHRPLSGIAIAVGMNSPMPPSRDVLTLSNKAAKLDSVTRLVLSMDDRTLRGWSGSSGDNSPQAVLDKATLLMEDASPDSVFGVLALLLRLAGWQSQERLAGWVASIERWETEGMVDEPFRAWPSLAAALAHANFSASVASRDEQYAAAWTATMRFAAECVLADHDPVALPIRPSTRLHRDAVVALRQEEQTYRDWLPHAQIAQLSLPLAMGRERRLLVDALLFVEDQPTGTAKVFYRTDKEEAPLGQGFCLAASYRPAAPVGSGNEFTITVDPRRGVVLDELCGELERRESEAWQKAGQERPNWAPRSDMKSHPDNPWNQPWYLNPTRTLIAAPRRVMDDRVEPPLEISDTGTKLTWREIQEAIWAVCSPLRGVMVEVPPGRTSEPDWKVVPLIELAEHAETVHGKSLLIARWPAAGVAHAPAVRSLVDAPVVDRALAALIRSKGLHPVALADLPALHGWTRSDLSGGFAIAMQEGLLVLDDWRETLRLDTEAIGAAFQQAARLDEDLSKMEAETLGPLTTSLDTTLRNRGPREQRGLVVGAALAMAELANLRGVTATVPQDADARTVRRLLDDAWGLDARLTTSEARAKGVADALKAVGDARVRAVTQFVALVAFPFYFATGLATQVGKLVGRWKWGSLSGTDPTPNTWFACFLPIFFAGCLLSWLFTRWLRSPGQTLRLKPRA